MVSCIPQSASFFAANVFFLCLVEQAPDVPAGNRHWIEPGKRPYTDKKSKPSWTNSESISPTWSTSIGLVVQLG